MVIDFTLLGNPIYVDLPQELIGWVGWLILFSIIVLLQFRWRRLNKRWSNLHWGIFIGLLFLTILTNIIFVIHFPGGDVFASSKVNQLIGRAGCGCICSLTLGVGCRVIGYFPRCHLGLTIRRDDYPIKYP